MNDTCELCGRESLEPAYRVEGSRRNITVQLCHACGLVQSTPRIDHAPRAAAAVSTGADWGNIRYGKSFRTQAMLDAVARHADLERPLHVLDVGSNRGSFARALLNAAPKATVTAVEPDERVAQSCAELPRCTLVEARIENTSLPESSFDLVHSCHTIEHLSAPMATLADHWRVLKPGGVLIVDAPNIALLLKDDIVEEWFIDKHLYHFSARTLARMIEAQGFEIVQHPDPADASNLLFVARKTVRHEAVLEADPAEVERARALITRYRLTRAANMDALATMAADITAMAPRRVALWGAGRLFDSLVVHGGFDPRRLCLLIDVHLAQHMPSRHGVTLSTPDALAETHAEILIVMSRDFAAEIAAKARILAPNIQIIPYTELLARAVARKAA